MKKVIKFIAGSMVMLLLTACGNVKKDFEFFHYLQEIY